MRRKRKALIDLDGTLIHYRQTYHNQSWRCALIISEAMGVYSPPLRMVVDLQYETDVNMMSKYGLSIHRFPRSWVRTYITLAQEYGVPIDAEVCDRLLHIARRFQDGPWPVIDGVIPVLEWLKSRYERIIITAGPDDIQNRKVDEALPSLRPHVDLVVPTPPDKRPKMAEIIAGEPENCFMIGDSRGSDIRPALALGITAIWIKSDTWAPHDADLDPKTHYTIHSIDQLPALLECLHRD